MPYRGLGSGIKRALEDWPDVDFTDDRDGCLFIATVHRKQIDSTVESQISSQKDKEAAQSSQKIIELIQGEPTITIARLAQLVGITDRVIKKQLERLQAENRIRRIGPDKGGRWEVVE